MTDMKKINKAIQKDSRSLYEVGFEQWKADLSAESGRPLYAVTMWSDENWIYVELPVKGQVPYICKFAFTEGGLSKALHVLRTARSKTLPSTMTMSKKPLVGHIAKADPRVRRPPPKTTEEQRKQATEVLRKLKLLNK